MAKRKGYAEGGEVKHANPAFGGGEYDVDNDAGPTFRGIKASPKPPPASKEYNFGMQNKYGPSAPPGFSKGGKVAMAKRPFEGSPKDIKQDKKGARKMGVSMKAYEKTPRDRAEDKAGQRQMYGKRK